MPRRNRTPKHTPFQTSTPHEQSKKAYRSRSEALQAIKEQQKYHLDLKLDAYQSPTDGKWHLTSTKVSQ